LSMSAPISRPEERRIHASALIRPPTLQHRPVPNLHPYTAVERSSAAVSPVPEPQRRSLGLPTICQPQFVKFLPPLYDRLTMHPACIVANTLTEHGHQDAQHTVPNRAQSLAMPLSFGPQSRIHLAEVRITLHGDARHVIQRLPQAGMTPAPHHHLTAFAALSRNGGHPTMRAQHLKV